MKKFSFVLVTIFTLLFGVFLSACTVKDPSITFNVENGEHYALIGEEVDIGKLMILEGIDAEDVKIQFSDDSFITCEGAKATASAYGETMVYAVHDDSVLASFKLIIKKPFSKVTNIQMSKTGLITWTAVYDSYKNETPTQPAQYKVTYAYEDGDPTTTQVSTNSFQLPAGQNGVYTVSVIACGIGKFADSEKAEVNLNYGFMPLLTGENFSFNSKTNVLSWTSTESVAIGDAKFDLYFGEEEEPIASDLTAQGGTFSYDLTENLAELDAGEYTAYLIAKDVETTNPKISQKSEEITITKLSDITRTNGSGSLNFSVESTTGLEAIKVLVGGEEFTSFTTDMLTEGKIQSVKLDGLAGGRYDITVYAAAQESQSGGEFYANGNSIEGKIVKLDKVTLTEGENTENADTYKLNVEVQNSFAATKLYIEINGTSVTNSGFSASSTQIETTLNLATLFAEEGTAARYNIVVYNVPNQTTVENQFVIESDASETYTFDRLAAAENVGHLYAEENSTITFDKIENAGSYKLVAYHNGAETEINDFYGEPSVSESEVTFTFEGKIEDILAEYFDGNTLTLRAYALCEGNGIDSYKEFTLTRLEISKASREDNTLTTYTWNGAENAEKYLVKYAVVSASDYNTHRGNLADYTASELQTSYVEEPSITLDSNLANYYYIEVYALPDGEKKTLNLTSAVLKDMFFVTETLEAPEVKFGYKEEYVGDSMSTFGSGYYIELENVKYAASFSLNVNGQGATKAVDADQGTSIYILGSSQLQQDNTITIYAASNDGTIKLNSATYTLKLVMLAQPKFADFSIDPNGTTLTIQGGKEGVQAIELYKKGSDVVKTNSPSENATIDIAEVTTSGTDILARYIGTTYSQETNLFTINETENGGSVYIDSKSAEFKAVRTDAPTNLQFKNANLVCTNAQLSGSQFFVLEAVIKAGSDTDVYNIKMAYNAMPAPSQGTVQVQILRGNEEVKNFQIDDVKYCQYEGGNYTFDLASLFEKALSDEQFSGIYNMASSVKFKVYVYDYSSADGTKIMLPSSYATLLNNPSSTELDVQKLASPTNLQFSYTYNESTKTGTLSWTPVETSYSGVTQYTVYRVADGDPETLSTSSASSYIIDLNTLQTSTDYTFFVVASNENYLAASRSQEVIIRILSPVSSVSISDNKLSFASVQSDVDHIDGFKYVAGETDTTISKDQTINLTGYTGDAKVQAVGSQKENRYNISSLNTTFKLANMTDLTQGVEDFDNKLTFLNSSLTFNTFAGNLDNLKYYLVMKDKSDATFTVDFKYKTNAVTSYTFTLTEENIAVINSQLQDGTLTISLYACVEAYSVSEGGTLYYDSSKQDATTLENGTSLFSVYKYTDTTTTKLASPTITAKFFDAESENNSYSFPDVELSIKGNYSTETEKIYIYLGSLENPVLSSDGYAITEDTTKIKISNTELTQGILSPGQSANIYVVVKSTVNFESSPVSITIYRHNQIGSLELQQATDGFTGYGHDLAIRFAAETDSTYAISSKLTLSIEYGEDGDDGAEQERKTETYQVEVTNSTESLTYALDNFISTHLSKGGWFEATVFVNSYANTENSTYYMASLPINSTRYNVLQAMTDGDIKVETSKIYFGINEGFNSKIGAGDRLVYKVECDFDGKMYDSVYTAEDEVGSYYIEIPANWAGEINLSVTACSEGLVCSATHTYTFSVTRVDAVKQIKFKRDESDLSVIKIVWVAPDSTTNVGGYKVELRNSYGEVITQQFIVEETEIDINDLYNVVKTEYLYLFSQRFEGTLSVATIGKNGAIQAKELTTSFVRESIMVKPDSCAGGIYQFSSVSGEKYIYRVYAGMGEDDPLTDWKIIEAEGEQTRIDVMQITGLKEALEGRDLGTSYLKIKFTKLGSVPAADPYEWPSAEAGSLKLDSRTYDGTMFRVSNEITDISPYKENGEQDQEWDSYVLKATLNNTTTFSIYASLKDNFLDVNNDLNNGAKESVEVVYAASNVNSAYTFDIMKVVSKLAKDYTSTLKVYFYVLQEGCAASMPYSYTVNLTEQAKVKNVVKLSDVNKETSDSKAGTYFLYERTLEYSYLGFYVKLSINALQGTATDVFGELEQVAYKVQEGIDKLEMTTLISSEYERQEENVKCELVYYVPIVSMYTNLKDDETNYDSYYAFRFTELLEDSLHIPNGAGSYNVAISPVIRRESTISVGAYETAYQDTLGQSHNFEFKKCAEPTNVNLQEGDLYWTEPVGKSTVKYNIYVIDSEQQNHYKIIQVTDRDYIIKTAEGALNECYYGGENLNLSASTISNPTTYYIAVSAVSSTDNIFELDSVMAYVTEGEMYQKIEKYSFNAGIIIEDGALKFDWKFGSQFEGVEPTRDNDLYQFIDYYKDHRTEISQAIANSFLDKEFSYPFRFNLRELLRGDYNIRFKFTKYGADGSTSSFTTSLNAIYLFQNFNGYEDEVAAMIENDEDSNSIVGNYGSNQSTTGDIGILQRFKSLILNNIGGIGSYKSVFDDFFEGIQTGTYRIEYCRVGNTKATSSDWNIVTQKVNDTTKSQFFITNSPTIQVDREVQKVSGVDANAYYFKVKLGQYTTYDESGEKTSKDVDKYILKFVDANSSDAYGFVIKKDGLENWNCEIISKYKDYEVEHFKITEKDGYLLIYLNLNYGTSIKGTYGESGEDDGYDFIKNGFYRVELFAAGDNYALGSKTTSFTVRYNSALSSFGMNDGEMNWTSELNTVTTVYYKYGESAEELQDVAGVLTSQNVSFDLSGDKYYPGKYDYLKFISYGSINQNTIVVDSDVFVMNNLYKLNSPKITTDCNEFVIDDTNNAEIYSTSYSKGFFSNYQVTNDAAGSAGLRYTNAADFGDGDYTADKLVTTYVPGTTGISMDSLDYSYKNTEESASLFSFTALGSTIGTENFVQKYTPAVAAEEDAGENYYYQMYAIAPDTSVALKSERISQSAEMLKGFPTTGDTPNGIKIDKGIITWEYDLSQEASFNLVYRVKVNFYKETNVNDSTGKVPETDSVEIIKYTAENEMDISQFEDLFPAKTSEGAESFSSMSVTIQAFNLNIAQEKPEGKSYELVEGGYAYGANLSYSNSRLILLSNGTYQDKLVLSDTVSNVKMDKGQLTWTYQPTLTGTTSASYTFYVKDLDENKNVAGSHQLVDGTYKFTFAEESDDEDEIVLSQGTHRLCVYADVGTFQGTDAATYHGIKSRASETVEIYKLPEAIDDDYTIESGTKMFGNTNVNYDVIDFSAYFSRIRLSQNELVSDENLELSLRFEKTPVPDTKEVVLTAEDAKVTVVSNERYATSDFFTGNVICVTSTTGEDAGVTYNIYAENKKWAEVDNADARYTKSSPFRLELTRVSNTIVISWDDDRQLFYWDPVQASNAIYIVEARYGTLSQDRLETTETRVYNNITGTTFTPTVLGGVQIVISIKVGEKSLTSSTILSAPQTFNLFNGGNGSDTPYEITNAQQFTNIRYRMEKDGYLNSFTRTASGFTSTVTESGKGFKFKIMNDISGIEADSGIVIPGTFYGTITADRTSGNYPTISYTTYGTATLPADFITIREGAIKSVVNQGTSMTFRNGVGLFEHIAPSTEETGTGVYSVENINISATYKTNRSEDNNPIGDKYVAVGGLAVKNNSSIRNVTLKEFTSQLKVVSVTAAGVTAYGGIVSYNEGTITGCTVDANISIADERNQTQHIFFGGICYTSAAGSSITNCTLNGLITMTVNSSSYPKDQVAGICVTSGISSPTDFSGHTVAESGGVKLVVSSIGATVYAGGIAVYARVSYNNNGGKVELENNFENSNVYTNNDVYTNS